MTQLTAIQKSELVKKGILTQQELMQFSQEPGLLEAYLKSRILPYLSGYTDNKKFGQPWADNRDRVMFLFSLPYDFKLEKRAVHLLLKEDSENMLRGLYAGGVWLVPGAYDDHDLTPEREAFFKQWEKIQSVAVKTDFSALRQVLAKKDARTQQPLNELLLNTTEDGVRLLDLVMFKKDRDIWNGLFAPELWSGQMEKMGEFWFALPEILMQHRSLEHWTRQVVQYAREQQDISEQREKTLGAVNKAGPQIRFKRRPKPGL